MLTLKDYVNWGITHSDKTASTEGVPLILEKCVKNKRMKQLEVYGNSVQNGTPSPENPIEVESVGEKCTKNLYDAEKYPLRNGIYINAKNGTEAGGSNATLCGTPNYIPCVTLRGETITISPTGGNSAGVAYYDENKVYIVGMANGSSSNTKITSVVPDNASYYRFSSVIAQKEFAQVELGDTATEYEPYGKYKVPVVVKGKNIFKPTIASTGSIRTTGSPPSKNNYGTVIDSTDLSDNKVVVTQTPNSDYTYDNFVNGYIYIEIPELVIGKKYVVSFDLNILDNPLNVTSLVMYALNAPIGTVSVTSTRCKKTFVYKEPVSGRKPDVELRCGGASFELSNVMITEEGHDDTFEPYIEPQTTNVYLNEPLRKIGDYADVLDFKGKKVIRNTYKRVYDGVLDNNNPFNMGDNESNFELSNEYDNFRRYTLSDPLPVIPKNGHNDYNHKPLCVQFPTFARPYDSTNAQKVSEEQIWFTNVGRNISLFLSKSREGLGDGSTSAFRAYLKENPITVYCAIYEPYEEPIECDIPTLTAKTSIVEIDTALLPSNIKGKYIKR